MSKDDKNLKFFQNQNSMNGLVNFIAEMRTCKLHLKRRQSSRIGAEASQQGAGKHQSKV